MAPDSNTLDAGWSDDDPRGVRLLVGGVVAVCFHLALLGIRFERTRAGPGRAGTAIEVSLVAATSPPQEIPIAPPAPARPGPLPPVKTPPEKPVPRTRAPEPPVPEEIAAAPTAEPAASSPTPAPPSGATGAGATVERAARIPGSEGLISARPRYKTNPKPRYPPIARRRRQEGVVVLSVSVNASGEPVEVEIETSSGASSLDEAAVEAVRQWRFEPGLREGEAVSSRVEVPIRFELE